MQELFTNSRHFSIQDIADCSSFYSSLVSTFSLILKGFNISLGIGNERARGWWRDSEAHKMDLVVFFSQVNLFQ